MWLVGMMGSGKTSVGRLVADRLGVPFYDSDEAVVDSIGSEIADLWDAYGEDHFRELEKIAIAEAPSPVVAAAGGGAVLDPSNRAQMRRQPPVVWLRARPETLAHRLGTTGDRPLLGSGRESTETLREILSNRKEAYRETATVVVETDDRSITEVAEEVWGLWPA